MPLLPLLLQRCRPQRLRLLRRRQLLVKLLMWLPVKLLLPVLLLGMAPLLSVRGVRLGPPHDARCHAGASKAFGKQARWLVRVSWDA